jgi:Uncharacterized flavoproteins
MTIEVRYSSKTGHTAQIAKAIAEQLVVEAKTVESPIVDDTDILFIGGGVYFGMVSGKIKKFIKNLDSSKVKMAVAFGTAGAQDTAIKKIKSLLAQKGIQVSDNSLLITVGHGGHKSINELDLQKAREFAQSIITQ